MSDFDWCNLKWSIYIIKIEDLDLLYDRIPLFVSMLNFSRKVSHFAKNIFYKSISFSFI